MMFEMFTVEEVNLMCIFDISSRDLLIEGLQAALPGFDEPELAEITSRVLGKLMEMSDDDYNALELYPIYEDYDED